jgi:hypothetical protein
MQLLHFGHTALDAARAVVSTDHCNESQLFQAVVQISFATVRSSQGEQR